jgi:16S rRNA (cytosine967-C5)-methyltransferase
MTPAARVAAAIEILDSVLTGAPAEKVLTNWARGHRFAGSGDRAAIRDLVYDALRCRRSFAHLGGAEDGRGLMLGRCRDAGEDPATLFTGARYAPDALTPQEAAFTPPAMDEAVALDLPDWLSDHLRASLGPEFVPVAQVMRHRAPMFLRVNAGQAARADVADSLAAEGIATTPVAVSPTALRVEGNPRRVASSTAYKSGRVELQDAASQALCDAIPLDGVGRVLDYCAGGGGKTLALAARHAAHYTAHDADPGRMRDLPARAARAGVAVDLAAPGTAPALAPFDLVLCDVPCSGSGTWRRAPEAKWTLDRARLDALCAMQARILDEAAGLVAPGGALAYATCSLLGAENAAQVGGFLERHPDWRLESERRFLPGAEGDGFYLALLRR